MNNCINNHNRDLVGKIALITGSTTGLGLAIAKELGYRGAKVALNYANSTQRAEAAYEDFCKSGGVGGLFKADVTEEDSIRSLIDAIKSQLGAVDILVPNATPDQPEKAIEKYAWSDYQEMIRFFMKSPFLLTQAVVSDMKQKKWGRIVNIGSEVVENGVPHFSAYVAAKGGQKAWTHSMSQELASFGITLNVVSPGWIPTVRHSDICKEDLDAYLRQIPVGRWGTPEDVAVAVADFCSPRASFLTGQTLCVNGGRSLS